MNELHIDKTHWKKYGFDKVCQQVNESTKATAAEGLDHVIGLELNEPNNLHITHWDTLEKETTFTRKFRKGQVLLGRRHIYQRNVAYVGLVALHRQSEKLPRLSSFTALPLAISSRSTCGSE